MCSVFFLTDIELPIEIHQFCVEDRKILILIFHFYHNIFFILQYKNKQNQKPQQLNSVALNLRFVTDAIPAEVTGDLGVKKSIYCLSIFFRNITHPYDI